MPLIKSLLCKKNKLMHKATIDEANEITINIENLIAFHWCSLLSDVDINNTKKLWSAVNKANNPQSKSAQLYDMIGDTDDFNTFFADIAMDSTYSKSDIDNDIVLDSNNVGKTPIYDFQVQRMLAAVKKTSSGAEILPYWLFTNCSFKRAQIISHILNLSIYLAHHQGRGIIHKLCLYRRSIFQRQSVIFYLYLLRRFSLVYVSALLCIIICYLPFVTLTCLINLRSNQHEAQPLLLYLLCIMSLHC